MLGVSMMTEVQHAMLCTVGPAPQAWAHSHMGKAAALGLAPCMQLCSLLVCTPGAVVACSQRVGLRLLMTFCTYAQYSMQATAMNGKQPSDLKEHNQSAAAAPGLMLNHHPPVVELESKALNRRDFETLLDIQYPLRLARSRHVRRVGFVPMRAHVETDFGVREDRDV